MKNIFLGLIVAFFATCIEPFDPPQGTFDDLLVVEGLLHDQPGINTIIVSKTIPIDSQRFRPETGAEVKIIDGDNNETLLAETAPGIYQTIASQFQGVIGKSYHLQIKTRGGDIVESSVVQLKQTPEIDSVHWSLKSIRNEFGRLVDGIDILVSTHDTENSTQFYRWEWEETWEFYSAFPSSFEYVEGVIVPRTEQINRCWQTYLSQDILIATSKNLSEDVINSKKLQFVNSENNRLKIKYSVLVKQYALSEEAFLYWQQLQDINESVGTLFDPQPALVQGNLRNLSDPNKPVLGFFDAASETEKRIFIQRLDLPPDWRVPSGFENCRADSVMLEDLPTQINAGLYLLQEIRGMFGNLTGYTMGIPTCSDCRIYGTNVKPSYWQ